ncbi:MAG: glycoside hydrolase family 32 protein [Bacteroidota bacterium]
MPETNEKTARYQEQHRPQFHFSPATKWMNDPNGMFYLDGTYHLFYQYYPDSTIWGPMHWGYAISPDLVHWEHQPIALFPDSLGYIFSGGAVVDVNNTSGLGTAENPPIIATFTHHNMAGEKAKTNDFQYQSLAYSTDSGKTWTKYAGNPVIPNPDKIKDFRDPKVVWHEATQKWVLVLAAYDRAMFYTSPNLIDWTFASDFAIEGDTRLWECPDLFPMKVVGTDEERWVLIVSIQQEAPNGGTATSYFVGDFDGQTFQCDVETQQWLDWGTDNYAFVTWNNLPESDESPIGIGWMSNWQYAQIVPTETWRSAMTVPRNLQLVASDSGYLLKSMPVKALQNLRKETISNQELNITDQQKLNGTLAATPSELEIEVDLTKTTASTFGLELKNDKGENLMVTFHPQEGAMLVDRTNSSRDKFSDDFFKSVHSAPVNFNAETLQLQVYIDIASIEIFVNDGELCFTEIFFPTVPFDNLSFFAKEGTCAVNRSSFYALKSIW